MKSIHIRWFQFISFDIWMKTPCTQLPLCLHTLGGRRPLVSGFQEQTRCVCVVLTCKSRAVTGPYITLSFQLQPPLTLCAALLLPPPSLQLFLMSTPCRRKSHSCSHQTSHRKVSSAGKSALCTSANMSHCAVNFERFKTC